MPVTEAVTYPAEAGDGGDGDGGGSDDGGRPAAGRAGRYLWWWWWCGRRWA